MGLKLFGLLLNLTRFVYDGFVFSVEYSVFLVLIAALVRAVQYAMEKLSEILIMFVVILILQLVFRLLPACLGDTCYYEEDSSFVTFTSRIIWDSLMTSVELSLYGTLVVTIYFLILILMAHLNHAALLWVILFVSYVAFRSVYGHTMYHKDDWE